MVLLTIFYTYFINNHSNINKILKLIKNSIKLKYCNRISAFFVGESILLNFNASKIVGGLFTNFPGRSDNKHAYSNLMREKIKEAYIESQECFEEIFSTKISFSKNITNFLDKHILETYFILKDGNIESLFSDIFTTLIQYNGAFYNLAFSPFDLEQNHTDILNFLYNSLNDYVRGINLLISIYIHELNIVSKNIYLYLILTLIIYFLLYIVNYFIIIYYYIIGYNKRTSFLEVFYQLNENVLRILITNCENLLKKLRESELKIDEEEIMDENSDKKIYFMFKERQIKRNSLLLEHKAELLINIKTKLRKILPKRIRTFMKFFGFCLIISFLYFIYNAIYFINMMKNTIYISQYLI